MTSRARRRCFAGGSEDWDRRRGSFHVPPRHMLDEHGRGIAGFPWTPQHTRAMLRELDPFPTIRTAPPHIPGPDDGRIILVELPAELVIEQPIHRQRDSTV